MAAVLEEQTPDQAAALRHLALLDPGAELFTFQTFDDDKSRKAESKEKLKFDPFAKTLHGALVDLWPLLVDLNQQGAGVFVTVNETKGARRRKSDLARIRAVFQDDDGNGSDRLPLEPHLVVQSSPGKFHRYLRADGLTPDEFDQVQRVLVEGYGSDPNAKDRVRVLRLAGFYHRKGAPYLVRIVSAREAPPYTREAILQAFQPKTRETPPAPQPTEQPAELVLLEARKLALEAARRTLLNGSRGRHAEACLLGNILRREGLPGTPEVFEAALQAFAENMRACDTTGQVTPIEWDDLRRALSDNYHKPSEPDQPRVNASALVPRGDDEGPITAAELLRMQFGELHWNIADILPAGTLLLFGKPKKGKSFLALLIAISVAAGRPVFGKATSRRPVLYLGLEDSKRRLARRLRVCSESLGVLPEEFGDRLHLDTTAERIDTGLIDELHAWMKAHPDTGLIVVDMLKKITASDNGRMSLYDVQSLVGDALTAFCHQYPALSIIVVHHSRKAESDDPFDLVSGTTGLSGSYDNLAAVTDGGAARVLHLTGRDIEGAEIPLLMADGGMYTLAMPDPEQAQTAAMSDTRRRVYEAIPASAAYTRAEIIEGCGLDEPSVDKQLRNLREAGLVKQPSRGKYQRTGKRFFDEPIVDLSGITGRL